MSTVKSSETSNNYDRVIHREGGYRVALCKDGLQYLLQRQRESTDAWDTKSFCATRGALERLWGKLTGSPAPLEVTSLPSHAVRATESLWERL